MITLNESERIIYTTGLTSAYLIDEADATLMNEEELHRIHTIQPKRVIFVRNIFVS